MSTIGPIGWIGLGAMGRPMARRLINQGHDLRIWARSELPADLRDELGDPPIVRSPGELARTCGLVHSIVGGPNDVESIYFDPAGLLSEASGDVILIDHTTSAPALARRIAESASRAGAASLDAPVSGGPTGATAGGLTMSVGGSIAALDRARPVLEILATTIIHHGAPGAGQIAKLSNQVLVAGSMLAIADARRLGLGAGLDDDLLRASLGTGIAGSPLLAFVWERAHAGDRRPGFAVDHLIKDLPLAQDLDVAGDPRLVELALSRYRALAAAGSGRDGTQALLLEAESGRPT